MGLYRRLTERKNRGEKLDIKQIAYETLYQLWWKEECSDGSIAKLYDVDKKKVRNLRHKWGVKLPETIINEFVEQFDGRIPTLDEDKELKTVSRESATLLRKINDLNDGELEALRLELIQRFPVFSEIKQEVDFLSAVERSVRQFG